MHTGFPAMTAQALGECEVVTLGETMAQVAPADGQFVEHAQTFQITAAGAESNVAIALSQLGHSVHWVSRVGDDDLGRRIVGELAGQGVDVTLVTRDADRRTGLFLKLPHGSATRVVYYRENSAATRLAPSDARRALSLSPRLVHVTGVTPALSASCRKATEVALRSARSAGAIASFDVNFRDALWRSPREAATVLHRLASMADIVFVGLDEAARLWGVETVDDCRRLLPDTPHLVVKDGGTGATEFDAAETTQVRARPVDVLEPVGAGDAFAAGWLHGRLAGADAAHRLEFGHIMAERALRTVADYAINEISPAVLRSRIRPDGAETR